MKKKILKRRREGKTIKIEINKTNENNLLNIYNKIKKISTHILREIIENGDEIVKIIILKYNDL